MQRVDPRRLGEAEPILDLMQDMGLQSVLHIGTITWEHQTQNIQSMIVTVFLSQDLVQELKWCNVSSTDYGSDHKSIITSFTLIVERHLPRQTRLLYQ